MNNLNEDLIKAREVVAGYKQFNQKTVECVKTYDSSMKIWTFEKKCIDPNAGEFKKKFIKSNRKEKLVNTKIPKAPKQKSLKPKKPKSIRPSGLKYSPRIKPADFQFDPNTLISQAYNYYLNGKTNTEIAMLMKKPKRAIISMLRQRDRQLGIKIEKNDSYEKIVELVKAGKKVGEISKIMKMSDHNVSYHIKNYNDSKSQTQIEEEYQEILSQIKKKAKLNQVDYCFSTWINQANCKLKCNLTTPMRIKRCRELVAQRRLIEDKEGTTLRKGIMYRIPKNK
jgi:hypothetical protein